MRNLRSSWLYVLALTGMAVASTAWLTAQPARHAVAQSSGGQFQLVVHTCSGTEASTDDPVEMVLQTYDAAISNPALRRKAAVVPLTLPAGQRPRRSNLSDTYAFSWPSTISPLDKLEAITIQKIGRDRWCFDRAELYPANTTQLAARIWFYESGLAADVNDTYIGPHKPNSALGPVPPGRSTEAIMLNDGESTSSLVRFTDRTIVYDKTSRPPSHFEQTPFFRSVDTKIEIETWGPSAGDAADNDGNVQILVEHDGLIDIFPLGRHDVDDRELNAKYEYLHWCPRGGSGVCPRDGLTLSGSMRFYGMKAIQRIQLSVLDNDSWGFRRVALTSQSPWKITWWEGTESYFLDRGVPGVPSSATIVPSIATPIDPTSTTAANNATGYLGMPLKRAYNGSSRWNANAVLCALGTNAPDTSCNGVDNDCDGTPDDNYPIVYTDCGIGVCLNRVATQYCENGTVRTATCTPNSPHLSLDYTCNNLDEDCQGGIDEDYYTDVALCSDGTCLYNGFTQCVSGQEVSNCATPSTPCVGEANCSDGIDNDTDLFTDCQDHECIGTTSCPDCSDTANCGHATCRGRSPCLAEICNNGLDEDGDTLVDCADNDDCGAAQGCAADPEPIVAPPLLSTNPSGAELTDFLFAGSNPIQRGMTEAPDPDLVSLLRGHVTTRSGMSLPNVRVSTLERPGYVFTDRNGWFYMAVEGGSLTLRYELDGYITIERQLETRKGIGGDAEPVIMISRSPIVHDVDMSPSASPDDRNNTWQVVRGEVEQDADGTRRPTLILQPGTEAYSYHRGETNPEGELVSLDELHLRMTEFTVDGLAGVMAMPGSLPPTSGYTYAIDLTPDEILASGEKVDGIDTKLSKPALLYLDNFLRFPGGTPVPTGYYDDDKGMWRPVDNGAVVKVLGVSATAAVIDTNNDGASTAADLQLEVREREIIATLYNPGESF
jgi:hypothetical protein